MSAETTVLSRLLRGMARRSVYWRRQRNLALGKRDQVLRDTRAALAATGNALGLNVVSHPSSLRIAALNLRAIIAETRQELRTARATIATLLEEHGYVAASNLIDERWNVPHPEALLLEVGIEDLSHEELRALVVDLRAQLATSHELNKGWVAYGRRVKERRDGERRLREQAEAWRESAEAARAWRLEVTPRLTELAAHLRMLAEDPAELPARTQWLLDVADALLGRPGADGSPWNRWLTEGPSPDLERKSETE